jgi:hypothetical protein
MDGVRADLRLDPLCPQGRERLVAPVERDDVRLPAVPVALVGDGVATRCSSRSGTSRRRARARRGALEPLELRDPERAEDVGQAVVEAGRRRCPSRRRRSRGGGGGARARRARPRRSSRAALAGRDDLARVEREAAEQPERPARRPAVARPSAPAASSTRTTSWARRSELLPGDRAAEEVDGEHGPRPRVTRSRRRAGRR